MNMTRMTRWQPFREMAGMRDMLDRFFGDEGGDLRQPLGMWSPAIDLYQTDDDVVVKATLPGVKPEDIQISVTGDTLTLRGEMAKESEVNEATYHLKERRFGSFARTLTLPSSVLADKARADFENGVLTLTLPKAEEVKPKTISVKAK